MFWKDFEFFWIETIVGISGKNYEFLIIVLYLEN